jgi:hypothetical protein
MVSRGGIQAGHSGGLYRSPGGVGVVTYAALTRYSVPIVRNLHDKRAVEDWIRQEGPYWPGARVVRMTKTGPRTIWKHTEKPQ